MPQGRAVQLKGPANEIQEWHTKKAGLKSRRCIHIDIDIDIYVWKISFI